MSFSDTKRLLPELLAPVGNADQLDAAILYGADAIYVGGAMSLRAARNFTDENLDIIRQRTRHANMSLYYCCNAFPRPHTWRTAVASLEAAALAEVDAFIIADTGLITFALKHFPHIPVHVSTQANTCNAHTVRFWHDQGVKRINLARELRLAEIYSIRKECPETEIECFVHGAQCLAISGHCLLSAWLNNRPANSGKCTQPCRFEYRAMPKSTLVLEEALRHQKNKGQELWHVTQGNEGFSAIWSPNDLCLLPFVPWFIRQGIHSLKIEGRMRNGVYVAQVLEAYKAAYKLAGEREHSGDDSTAFAHTLRWRTHWKTAIEELMHTLSDCSSRPLDSGFFLPQNTMYGARIHSTQQNRPHRTDRTLARVEERLGANSWRICVRGLWDSGRSVQILLPGGERPALISGHYTLEDHKQSWSDTLHSGTEGILHCELADIPQGVYVVCS